MLDLEHSRYRKILQVQQSKFVLAEVALRFWNRFDNFWMWSILPLYTKSNFWALEQALIQLWQPRRNIPFIYQFFNCRKGFIKRTPFPTPRQFGTFSLWRQLRWASTPNPIRQALCSRTFHNRVDLWEIIQDLSSNLSSTVSHGEAGSFQCHWSAGMLLSLPPCQQVWRTTEILRIERHRPGHQILERQANSSTSTSSSSMAFDPQLAIEIENL